MAARAGLVVLRQTPVEILPPRGRSKRGRERKAAAVAAAKEEGARLFDDAALLHSARLLRMFGLGAVGVVLLLLLHAIDYSPLQIALLLTCALLGDLAISLVLSARADQLGRRRTLDQCA